MTMKEALFIIDSMRSEWYDEPATYYQKRDLFSQQSYAKSAMDEIIMYLIQHENENPIDALDDFRRMMNEFCRNAKNEFEVNRCYIFSVYHDVATDVLDVLLGAK